MYVLIQDHLWKSWMVGFRWCSLVRSMFLLFYWADPFCALSFFVVYVLLPIAKQNAFLDTALEKQQWKQ